MGSLARKLKRERARKAHANLKTVWDNERWAQEQILESGQELPKNTPSLIGRKKPNFQQFLEVQRRVKAQAEAAQKAEAEKSKEEIKDLDWKEEEAPQ